MLVNNSPIKKGYTDQHEDMRQIVVVKPLVKSDLLPIYENGKERNENAEADQAFIYKRVNIGRKAKDHNLR
jgi:hypothetical protein